MGFLSAYEGVDRLAIPHPEKDYWVDVKRHVTHGATEKSAAALQGVVLVEGKAKPTPDVFKSQSELVLASVENWNLDDDNGQVWPINMQSIRRLPEAVFDQIHDAVKESNKPQTAAERRKFPDVDADGDQVRERGTAQPVDVLGGAGAMEAPGVEAG